MRRVVREVYGERLEAVCGDEPPEVRILYSPPFFINLLIQSYTYKWNLHYNKYIVVPKIPTSILNNLKKKLSIKLTG